MPVHPEAQALMARLVAFQQEHSIPPRAEQSVEQQRHYSRMNAILRQPETETRLASVEDVMLDTRAGPRRARVYRPLASGPLPTLVYVHGGGYILGGIEETEAETRRFAASIPANVVSLSYRLAPEHPWPAAVDDVEDQVSAIASLVPSPDCPCRWRLRASARARGWWRLRRGASRSPRSRPSGSASCSAPGWTRP